MLIKWSQSMFKVLVVKYPDGDVEHVYLKASLNYSCFLV